MKLDENQIIDILDSHLYYDSDAKVKDSLYGLCVEYVSGVLANSHLGDMITDVIEDKTDIEALSSTQKRRISQQILSYVFYGLE